jgi:hypothetical protein
MTNRFGVDGDNTANAGDRSAAWRFIRGFAVRWQSPLIDGDGWAEADLADAEARLGLRLPAALREAYQLFGRRKDLTSNQDVLLSPSELRLDDRREALVFRMANQAVACWGISVAELDKPDPPVVIRTGRADKDAERWKSWLDRFSLACVEIVLSECLFASDDLGANRQFREGEAELLEQRYSRLPLPDYPTSQTPTPAIRWFTGPDLLMRDDQGAWLWVRARTAKALDALRKELPGDWTTG